MSLTVTTSTVETSWQEIDVVMFNNNTLADINSCITEVQDRLQRGTLTTSTTPSTTQVTRWLIQAKEKFMMHRNFSWARRYAYATGTAGSYRFGLPPDYRGGDIKLRDVTSGYSPMFVEIYPRHVFDSSWPDPSYESSNRPEIATIKNMELWFQCPLDAAYKYELDYTRSGDDQTAADMSYIPEAQRFACCDWATYRAFTALKEFDSAQVYKVDWGESIMEAKKADGKQRWASNRYQCVPWW